MGNIRVTACKRWHPKKPAQWRKRKDGRTFCVLCRDICSKAARQKDLLWVGKPYGIVPLKWRPPPQEYICSSSLSS